MVLVLLSILLEVVVIFLLLHYLGSKAGWVYSVLHILSIILVLVIYGSHKTASVRMTWIMLIMLVPIVGTVLFLIIGLNWHTLQMRKRYTELDKILLPLLPPNEEVSRHVREKSGRLSGISAYLKKNAGYPVYENTKVTYYDDGLKGLNAQLEELAKAERFIFMEYHAIEDAESWHEIQKVLVERAKAGVEVRIFYDDMGSIGFINTNFVKKMESLGLKCRVFNPFAPGFNFFLNNRDHRKITVIDGRVGFTGGYNLANEYFHRTEPYGFWKDTGVRLEGDAVQSLTVIFLEMWNAISKYDVDDKDFRQFLTSPPSPEGKGFVQPYADSPMDGIAVGEDVYMSIAEGATEYAWYITPYLIITDEMNHVLTLAAMRGVDVRIITPGIPDKKMVYSLTRSYYNGLARHGVRIFEFTPGFCHAKMSVSDDLVATCGTINMDYRSLYHHFENGCLLADCDAVMDIKHDFEETFAQCREVTDYYVTGRGAFMRFGQMLLRLAAPLM
ncbi:MAG: cardiolipin synthase [Lachnospiraceae bacterium]|nr:cardiolipin synthase [Lachnospiraceae bacterium]